MINGIGLSEMAVIFFLIIILFKPQDLPAIVRGIARFFGKIRQYTDSAKKMFNDIAKM